MITYNLKDLFDNINNKIDYKSDLMNYIDDIKNYKGLDWEEYVIFNNEKYNRNIVFKNEKIELIIITWLPNQETPNHEHPKNGCLFKVLKGKIDEILIKNNNKIKKTYLKDDYNYIHNNIGTHKMINLYQDYCVSLHIYSPPY